MPLRKYRRFVISRTGTQEMADRIATEVLSVHPDWDLAVELTPVAISRYPWRVIRIRGIEDGTPDVHPSVEKLRKEREGAFDYDPDWDYY